MPPSAAADSGIPFYPTESQYGTLIGYEGKGVWVLDFYAQDDQDAVRKAYNLLPPTFDYNEHLRNLKAFNAMWHEDGSPWRKELDTALADLERQRKKDQCGARASDGSNDAKEKVDEGAASE